MIFNIFSRKNSPVRRTNYLPPKKEVNVKVFQEYMPKKAFFKRKTVLWLLPSFILFGTLAVGGTSYANYSANEPKTTAYIQLAEAQTFEVPENVKPLAIEPRGTFSAEIVKTKISWAGYTDAGSFINDPTAKVQYPFGIGIQISSPYGARTPICVDGKCNSGWHDGTDFGAPEGTPIQAIADGVVKTAVCEGNYGCHVEIEHEIDGDTITSLYAHMKLDSTVVKPGQVVQVGDLIGEVGNTGFSDGDHLHFEIWVNGNRIDPMSWDKWNTK